MDGSVIYIRYIYVMDTLYIYVIRYTYVMEMLYTYVRIV